MNAAGALKFYENTEDLLRTGRFETALLRYIFLKGQIVRHPGYRPLVVMIDQRLDFLKAQMKLSERDFIPLPPPRVRKSPPRKTPERSEIPPPPSPADKSSPEVKESDSEQDRQAAHSPAVSPALGPEPSPGVPERSPKPEVSVSEGEKSAEGLPPPSPSRWQRLKKRLQFWQR